MSRKGETKFHIMVAAEAFAAGMFAQLGYDVLVQYGANQPEYDFIISTNGRMLRVSVKGSQNGSWGLAQDYKKRGRDYHTAINTWAAHFNNQDMIFCFVQFAKFESEGHPQLYLATLDEVKEALMAARRGVGDTALHESHEFKGGIAAGTVDKIPDKWRFSKERAKEIANTGQSFGHDTIKADK